MAAAALRGCATLASTPAGVLARRGGTMLLPPQALLQAAAGGRLAWPDEAAQRRLAALGEPEMPLVRLPLGTYPDARCLDGSPGAYYFRRGGEAAAGKWVVFLEGWGFCDAPETCLERSKTHMGSSLPDPETIRLDEPYLSINPAVNPLTHDWTVAYLKTCDGAYYGGTRGKVSVNGTDLYYNGEAILHAFFAHLTDAGLGNATEVVVGGNSAGGIAVLSQLDAMRGMLPTGARVVGFSDSGVFLSTPIYEPLKRFVTEGQQAGRMANSGCLLDNAEAPWRCFISSISAIYLKTPVFVWQSRYDNSQIEGALDDACQKSSECVNAFGANMTATLPNIPGAGVFEEGCSHHCWSLLDPVEMPQVHGLTAVQAFAKWYGGGHRSNWRQEGTFPCARCCPALARKAEDA